jgi:hypothetical protein
MQHLISTLRKIFFVVFVFLFANTSAQTVYYAANSGTNTGSIGKASVVTTPTSTTTAVVNNASIGTMGNERDIFLDHVNGFVYWCEGNSTNSNWGVYRAPISPSPAASATAVITGFTGAAISPWGVTVDISTSTLYLMYSNTGQTDKIKKYTLTSLTGAITAQNYASSGTDVVTGIDVGRYIAVDYSVTPNMIYWADQGLTAGRAIYRAPVNTTTVASASNRVNNPVLSYTVDDQPHAIAIDPDNQRVYWVDANINSGSGTGTASTAKICYVPTNAGSYPTNVTVLYNAGTVYGWGLALDRTNQVIYYGENAGLSAGQNEIRKFSISNPAGTVTNAVTGLDAIKSIKVDVGTFIQPDQPTTWNGSTWSNGTPSALLDAIIASSTAPGSFTCKAVTINNGVALTTTGITATVNGNITNNGNGIAGTGGLSIAANSTISGNAISFNGVLTVNSGATLTTGGLLTLSSNATNTARVANSAGSISGNVTVERYIPAKRAWRLLTAPLRGSNTSFYSSWQNNGSVISNTGVEIFHPSGGTGIVTGGGNALNGNLRTYNTTTNTWTAVTNTQSTNLFTNAGNAANNAFLIFPTAPYGGGNIVTGSTITTLKATGALQTGTQTFSIPNAAFSNAEKLHLIGNPYASPVDFNLLTRTNVTKRFWTWDPQLAGVGGYVLVSDLDNDNTFTVTPSSTQTQHIQSGQAFFVEVNNTGASVTFNEDDKSSSNINTVFRTGTGTERLSIDMINPTDGLVIDGILAEYNNNFSNGIAAEDGQKLFRSGENVYLLRNTKPLMLEGRPLIDNNDTLFMVINDMEQQAYRFNINGSNFATDANLSAFLKDKFLNTETAISLSGTTLYNFTVTADVNSKAADRFMVVFRNTTSLPVTLTNVKAYQQNSGINVEWNTQSESGMQQYEVEKSANGTNYSKVNTTAAKSGTRNSYNWFDANPTNGANYYRIKAISLNGEVKYSSIVVVKLNSKGSTITLYPNPVKGSTIQLQMSNLEKGNYSVTLFNQLGQQVLNRVINHNGGSSNQTVELGTLASGVYELRLSNGQTVITQKLIKE